MIMRCISLETSTLANTGYPWNNFPWHYNHTSSHSFKAQLSLPHHVPSMQVSFGTSPQHCRHIRNGPSMKSSLPGPHTAPLKLESGSQPMLTPMSIQCQVTNTNGPQTALI